MPLVHPSEARAIAQTAYQTLEPYHLVTYFTPHTAAAAEAAGVGGRAWYLGTRGGPLGEVPASVIGAAFFNFNPAMIERAWPKAVAAGLPAIAGHRDTMVDTTLRECLGDRVTDLELAELAVRFGDLADSAPTAGRVLGAAWQSLPRYGTPHLDLWRATSVLREWRGDAHVAALTVAGLSRVEALVLHEAHDPRGVRKRTQGRDAVLFIRAWDRSDWDAAVATLAARDLVSDDGTTLLPAGCALYDELEALTDDASAAHWSSIPDAADLLLRARPYVKAVIDAGILPGTRKK